MIQLKYLVSQSVALALKNLMEERMTMANSKQLVKFVREFEDELKVAQKVYAKNKDALEAKNPEIEQEWREFLDTSVSLEKLPKNILDKVEFISPAEYLALEPLLAE